MKRAIYPESFNPFTNGHLDIVRKAAEIFDEVIIVIAQNYQKENDRDNNLAKQIAIENVIIDEGLKNVKVTIIDDQLLIDYMRCCNIKYIVRGLRNTMDYNYEENIAAVNKLLYPTIEYIYFRTDNAAISSSMVRELKAYGKDISNFVPKAINDMIKEGELKWK